ncbi:MAG TPA: alanyl-tRNA editing protein [Bryobacteraceae bacterium]|jgi:alanyl-tRNA synthetase|nr:alanyl-tRNA editing protein [Bryobacteraceae bacterium]
MTERLYYNDCYLREFQARVVAVSDDGRRVWLDRTAFYPTSGGQPFDAGTLGGAAVVDVVDEDDRVVHVVDAPVTLGDVTGEVDWTRRFDHMQQHTGQHLLSAVFEELYKIGTVSFHMGATLSTIDVSAGVDTKQIERVEERCAEIVAEARPVLITFEDASADLGLRKVSERTGTLRIVSIGGLDRSACGGTHVRSTAEIGAVQIRKLEKIRGTTRVEFVCGMRALRAARADFRLLAEISRTLSTPFEEIPALVAAQIEKTKTLEKNCVRLSTELARREGGELHSATPAGEDGVRRVTQKGPIDDAARARAQAFIAGGKAVFLAICEDPASVLLAASADSGMHAGNRVKEAVSAAGGRGGGNQTLGQGSVPANALEGVVAALS